MVKAKQYLMTYLGVTQSLSAAEIGFLKFVTSFVCTNCTLGGRKSNVSIDARKKLKNRFRSRLNALCT